MVVQKRNGKCVFNAVVFNLVHEQSAIVDSMLLFRASFSTPHIVEYFRLFRQLYVQ